MDVQPHLALYTKLTTSCRLGGKASLAHFGTQSKDQATGWAGSLLNNWLIDNLGIYIEGMLCI